MAFKYVVLAVAIVGLAGANPASKPAFWKGTPMDGMVEEMRSMCSSDDDSGACLKYKIMNFLDTVFKKDNFQLTDDIEVHGNGFSGNGARSIGGGALDTVEQYLKSHDVTFKLPVADAKVTVSPRNIDDEELTLTVRFPKAANGARSAVEARKSKLKKIVIPIMVFILLKAMTLIPMALGILGLKAWNSLQLSFFSFIVSVGLAIFQLCKKIAADNHHPHIAAHGPWDTRRSLGEEQTPEYVGQDLAYNAYA
ncbi:osiris 19 [Culex quinquefasciatus]|uniref:Osiris 19 n=1 Tax=Culex quinquefasciatus TaxID=7176 RepID=B0WS67_CULQU|nr:uncharacterized protein LOC6042433 [Culex quinquefasciatus]EDS33690.1 osiris 19 [Culex quinquefasciatus]|eukprot:XP_001851551.1 osiris 19 [Culex quinquefasciatus]